MNSCYIAGGKQVQCPHCAHVVFEGRKVLLNTRGATFFNFDWLNRSGTALTCQKCGRIEWFASEPQEAEAR